MKKLISFLKKIFKISARRFFAEHYTYRASALAFTTLLSIVPLVSIVVFFVSIFPIFSKLSGLAEGYIFANFIPTSSQVIQHYLGGFVENARRLPILSFVVLVLTTAMLILTIEHAFHEIWQAPKRKKNVFTWVLSLLILIFAPMLIGLTVFFELLYFLFVLV